MAVTIRRAEPDDWQVCRDIRLRALREEPQAYESTLDAERHLSDQQWRDRLTRASTFLAVDHEKVVGTAVGLLSDDGDMLIVAMYVAADARGRGIAAQLIDEIGKMAVLKDRAGLSWMSPTAMPQPSAAIPGTDSYRLDNGCRCGGIVRFSRRGSHTCSPARAAMSPIRNRVMCVSIVGVRSSPEELLARLDPEQREVATTLGGPLAVIAGAGTGKTRAITHRIAYGVAIGAYNPTSVLAVTFTARAAGELRGRLQQLGAHGVQARTFHSAALRQAQYFWPRIYGGDLPSVVDNRMSLVAEAASRLRVRVDTPKLRDLVGEISWAKVSNVSVEDYPRLAAERNRVLASLDPETIGRIFAGYESAKRDRSRIDFEDILLCAAALISEHPGGRRRRASHLPSPGRRRVPGCQPVAGGTAQSLAWRPPRGLRGR